VPYPRSTQDAGWHVKVRAMNLMWWAERSSQLALLLLTAVATHLLMSFSQTVMHYRLGHRRLGGVFFRNHIDFHHVHYSKDHLASLSYIKTDGDGNNTPFFLIPVTFMLLSTYFILPFEMFFTEPSSTIFGTNFSVRIEIRMRILSNRACQSPQQIAGSGQVRFSRRDTIFRAPQRFKCIGEIPTSICTRPTDPLLCR
jgi:hypothetical protein